MRDWTAAFAVLACQVALGETRQALKGPDLADLCSRVSGCAYVLKGRLLETKWFSRTDLPPPVQVSPNLWKVSPRITGSTGGTLYTVTVEQVLCRRAQFEMAPSTEVVSPSLVHLFVPGSLRLPGTYRPESFQPDREYLLFLYDPGGQAAMVTSYGLDPGVTYFRALDGRRGAVALPDAANPEKPGEFITPLVQAVTAFCEAVKGPDVATKIRQLRSVRDLFEYPSWRRSVDEAIRGFQKQATH